MNRNPLVSIIIPTYNREKTISRAILSALNQTYKNIEIIVIDNCSTDNSNNIISQISLNSEKIKYFQNSFNIGPVKNWIECIKKSSGEYIKFLFSDDELEKDWIEKAISTFSCNNDIAFVFSPALIETNKSKFLNYNYFNKSKKINSRKYIFLNYFFLSMPVSPCCAIFRTKDLTTSLVEEIPNPFNIIYSKTGAGNDLLLYLNIAKLYPNVYFLKETHVNFFGGEDSLTLTNNLSLNYEYAKINFLNIHNNFNLIYSLKLYFSSNKFLISKLKFRYKISFYEFYLLLKMLLIKKG